MTRIANPLRGHPPPDLPPLRGEEEGGRVARLPTSPLAGEVGVQRRVGGNKERQFRLSPEGTYS